MAQNPRTSVKLLPLASDQIYDSAVTILFVTNICLQIRNQIIRLIPEEKDK